MKPKHQLIITCLAFAISGSANAASTLLLTDNFNGTSGGNQIVSSGFAADQGGSLVSVGYTTAGPGNSWNTQRGNGGTIAVAYDTGSFSLNRNFATDANTYNQALQISFVAYASGFTDASAWGSFTVGSAQNLFAYDGGSKFGFLFRQNDIVETYAYESATLNNLGNTSYVSYDSDSFTLLLSDTGGTGSAFSGNGSVAKLYVAGNLLSTTTLDQLSAADGYLSFGGMSVNWGAGNGQANIDNLAITVIPEPSAALLGGLGLLALLRRRR